MDTQQTLAFLPNVGMPEMVVIGIVMLLLFGRRLPEVGKSLGQGIVEFKKGLKDVTDDIKKETTEAPSGAAKFDAAKPAHNPDILSSVHTTSTPMAEPVEVKEKPAED